MRPLARKTIRAILAAAALALLAPAPLAPCAHAADARLLMPVKARPAPPGFILPDINGRPYRIEGMRGHVVVVNFWWTGCPSCLAEMPSLERLWQSLRDKGVIVLAIHMGGRPEVVRRYIERMGVSFPVLWDSGRIVSRQWGVRFTPTTMIIGPDGRLDYIAFGGRVWDNAEIRQTILQLRNQP